jgi:hypothetical protein
MSIFPKFFFTLFGNAPLPFWLRSYIARVEEDGGTIVDRNHTKEVYADVIDYEPSLIQSCDSGKAGTLYSIIPSRDLLLYQYTGAAAAYSLRQLSAGTVYVVKVRRSGDNAELDFTADEVSDGTLEAWVVDGGGTEDGFVKTWYDQSGNTNNATQATAANQPKIVSSGTLVTENGKATVSFNGSNNLNAGDIINSNYITIAAVTQLDAGGGGGRGVITKATIGDDATGSWEFRYANSDITSFRYYIADTRYSLDGDGGNAQLLTFMYHKSDGSAIYEDSSLSNSDAQGGVIDSDNNDVILGDFDVPTGGYDGNIQEIIIYDSDQSANRTGIEANINAHYNIYP